MPENEARAWWADVQHVRESIERRRGAAAEAAASDELAPARRFARAAAEPPVPRLDDLDWPTELPGRSTRRFERAAASDDARPTRRRATAVTEADRASGRGRRPHADADVQRSRSHRPDDATARGTDPRARAASTPERRPGAADATGRPPVALDSDVDRVAAPAPAARRTVQITGRPVGPPRLVEVERRRPGRRPAERVGPRPDRIAMYAVLLAFFLILVAATSSHGAI